MCSLFAERPAVHRQGPRAAPGLPHHCLPVAALPRGATPPIRARARTGWGSMIRAAEGREAHGRGLALARGAPGARISDAQAARTR